MAHIGIDARLVHYRLGGISTYVRRLIAALELLDTGNRYTVFQSRKATAKITNGFQERRLWTPPHHRMERWALSVELLRHRLDILHSPDFIPPLGGARRHVISVLDLTFLHYPQYKDAAARRYYNDQIQWAVEYADHILTISDASKRDMMAMLGVPAEKITVHLLGVDARFQQLPQEESADWQKKLELPEQFILFVGTLEPRKNIPALLDAYGDLPKSLRDTFSLLLVGRTGWLFDDTLSRIQTLQSQGERIAIRSDISDEALPAVYNLASALVLPSFYEGFGIPPLEAMACGTPVIVSDVSSLPEVVGEVGLRVDPYNPHTLTSALERALTDSAWRQFACEAGLQRVKQFTWKRAAQVALSVYGSVL